MTDVIRSKKTGAPWEPIIGLEVHCQLKTRTKLFCGCRNEFGAPPNSRCCPVCTGQPGALPVLNSKALALGIRAGLALGCEVAPLSKFDRKNYFYCDLPKGFQISQFDAPICRGGGIVLEQSTPGKTIRLHRIHLEEDAGKAIHDRGETTLVDLNRAGIPLIESVTEADIRSSAEAFEYLSALKEILRFSGVSDCDMEKGSLRCDVNVSVHPPDEPWGTKVELKNLNSFRNVRDAIEHEIARQIEAYEGGDPSRFPVQETRSYDPDSGTTKTMRSKEDAHDYRYFPEPDLPPVHVGQELLATQREALAEPPASRRRRYVEELGLSSNDAGVLTGSRTLADFFEETARLSDNAKQAANWIANDVLAALGESEGTSLEELRLRPRDLAALIALQTNGAVNTPAARKVLRAMLETGKEPAELVRELGLEQVDDVAELESWCRSAMEAQPQAVEAVRGGTEKALGALVGSVMKASRGKANPKLVRDLLLRLIADG